MLNKDNLSLIALESINGFGKSVDEHLQELRDTRHSFIVPIEETRFSDGEGKVKILGSIRNQDVCILTDLHNDSITYKMRNYINHKSPDDHYQDLKRVIYAIRDHSQSNSIIMPLLYESRQHKRRGRESLDCATALQELIGLNTKNIITFDVHDPNIQNAIPTSSFESFYPTKELLSEFIKNEDVDYSNMFVIAPDAGAVSRANLYANIFNCDMGFFRKERDLSKIVDGKALIVEHQFVGGNLENKAAIIVDDMIASGESMLKCCLEAKKRGATKVYLMVSFSLFTNGIKLFEEAYNNNLFDGLYTTNLTYVDEEIKNKPWIHEVDMSFKVAQIINNLNLGESLTPLLNDTGDINKYILKLTKKK